MDAFIAHWWYLYGAAQELLETYWPGIVAASGFVLAFLFSTHAMLHKREARSAAAWTGLIWLVPFIGSLLYVLIGVNRVQRRAHELGTVSLELMELCPTVQPRPGPPHQHSLAELGNRLTGLPLLPGNHLDVYEAGEAFELMLNAVDAAHHSVYLATYIFGNDAAGKRLIDALGRACRRGVKVRVLVDGLGSLYSFPTAMWRLRHAGVPAARFLYSLSPLRMSYMNLRNHRKVMVVDGQLGFTGGMNIRAGYLKQPATLHDVHLSVEGPVVEHLLKSFVADWQFTTGETLEAVYRGPFGVGTALARGISAGPDSDVGKRRLILLAAIGSAQRDVRIVTPYFVPDQALLTALSLAALRGVRVQVVLPERNNLRVVQWASTHVLDWLVRDGVELYFSAPPFDHAKLMTVDSSWSLVGSGNWDARSLRLNFEFDLECYGDEMAGRLNRLIDRRLDQARLVSLAELCGQSYLRRLRNAFCYLLEPYL
ncbi:phospholipase D-like domain-containing protein [Isoalcanivorax beigongshangi]|uniref:Phospholipase D-like domain-containing protein n=1 Tax=Isoalcanivorax beigongshangi TaxID=3238810 RepID=A0ABV4AHT7_9GAMM